MMHRRVAAAAKLWHFSKGCEMATNRMFLVGGALWMIGSWWAAAPVESAPPSNRRPTTTTQRRPTTTPSTQAKPRPGTTTAPKSGPAPATAPKTSPFAPPPVPGKNPTALPPIPPQPRRDDEPQTLPKSATEPMPIPQAPVEKTDVVPQETKLPPLEPSAAKSSRRTADAVKTDSAPSPTPSASLAPIKPDADGKYLLRYSYSAGETMQWEVEHRARIVTSVQETTQTAETVTRSKKVWKVVEALPGGETKFIHLVAAIEMKQKVTGRQETSYNSETDKDVPPIFADAAKQIGVPLAEVTIDTRGNVLKRADKIARPEGSPTNTITLILPDRPLAVGESWTSPFDLSATDAEGNPKVIKARHKLTLEKVEGDLATLKNETQILSPLGDPTIEAQVVQAEQAGTVTFDLRRGRITSQSSDLDKQVFGFQGPESKLHYVAQFRESLTEGPAKTASTPSDAKK
jgi:hypothetical protein